MCNAICKCDVLFYPIIVFSTGFSDGVFNEACAYCGDCLRGSVVKYVDSILEGKEKVEF
jgi:hypothetical protein